MDTKSDGGGEMNRMTEVSFCYFLHSFLGEQEVSNCKNDENITHKKCLASFLLAFFLETETFF